MCGTNRVNKDLADHQAFSKTYYDKSGMMPLGRCFLRDLGLSPTFAAKAEQVSLFYLTEAT